MLSQTTEYALRAMSYLAADPDQPRTSEQIAAGTKVPAGYLNKVFQFLTRAQLVHAQRGPHGGFRLARSLDRITLLDIVNAVEPLRRIEKCPLDNPAHLQLCPLHRRLDEAVATVEGVFGGTTLGELVNAIDENERLCQFPAQPTVQGRKLTKKTGKKSRSKSKA